MFPSQMPPNAAAGAAVPPSSPSSAVSLRTPRVTRVYPAEIFKPFSKLTSAQTGVGAGVSAGSAGFADRDAVSANATACDKAKGGWEAFWAWWQTSCQTMPEAAIKHAFYWFLHHMKKEQEIDKFKAFISVISQQKRKYQEQCVAVALHELHKQRDILEKAVEQATADLSAEKIGILQESQGLRIRCALSVIRELEQTPETNQVIARIKAEHSSPEAQEQFIQGIINEKKKILATATAERDEFYVTYAFLSPTYQTTIFKSRITGSLPGSSVDTAECTIGTAVRAINSNIDTAGGSAVAPAAPVAAPAPVAEPVAAPAEPVAEPVAVAEPAPPAEPVAASPAPPSEPVASSPAPPSAEPVDQLMVPAVAPSPLSPALSPARSRVPTMATFKQAVVAGSFEELWAEHVSPLISSSEKVYCDAFALVQKEVEIEKVEAVEMQRAENLKVAQEALAAEANLQEAKNIQSLLAHLGLSVSFAKPVTSPPPSGPTKRSRAPASRAPPAAASKKEKQSNSVRPPVFKGRTAENTVKLDHDILVEAHAELMKVVEADPDLGVYTERSCQCADCLHRRCTDHGFNYSVKHAVLILGLKDTEETEFAWRVEVVEHSVNCALAQNGPEPLGENAVRVDRHYFDDGPVSSNTKCKLHALYVEMGLPENSNWTVKQRANKDPELVALKQKYHELSEDEEKAKVKDLIVSRYLVLAKQEGYLNQHVIYQLPCAEDGTPDPNAKYFVMIPAACYYPGLELDQDLFPGFKMTCTQGNKSRLTQVPCQKLFGKYGYYEGVEPVTQFTHKGKWKGAWPTMWYKDLDAPVRAEKSTLIAHFTAAAAVPPGEPGHLSNVPSKEELQKLDLEVLQSVKAVTDDPAVDAFSPIEDLEHDEDSAGHDGEPGPSKRPKY